MDLKAKLALHHKKTLSSEKNPCKPEESSGTLTSETQEDGASGAGSTFQVQNDLAPVSVKGEGTSEGNISSECIRETIYEELNHEYGLSRLLPGTIIKTEYGEYFHVEYRYPLGHFHGRFHLGALVQEELAALCGVLKDQELVCPANLQNLVFMDTETTGLAGGAGTYAFLVGLGYFTEEEFVLNQFMMEDYHQELAMLEAVKGVINKRSHVVSFNGKSFDWPLLETRFTYHRMCDGFRPIHVDLLHPARRYYKQRLVSCRLGSLEDSILGFQREGDISGAEVPTLFFRYVEERDGRIIQPVFQHNHWDILTLVTLLTHLVQAYLLPEEVLRKPEDLYSAGKIHEDLGELEQALNCYRQSLEQMPALPLKQEILTRLAFLFKRMGRMEEACEIWLEFIQMEGNMRIFPYLELAKYFEHQAKDYQRALEMTYQARELLNSQRRFYSNTRFKELQGELEHRDERLRKKVSRQELKGALLMMEEDNCPNLTNKAMELRDS